MNQGLENFVNPCGKRALYHVARGGHIADVIMMAGEGAGPPLGLEPFIHQVCPQVLAFFKQSIELVSVGGRSQSSLLPGRCDRVQTMGGTGAQFLLKFTTCPQRVHARL